MELLLYFPFLVQRIDVLVFSIDVIGNGGSVHFPFVYVKNIYFLCRYLGNRPLAWSSFLFLFLSKRKQTWKTLIN